MSNTIIPKSWQCPNLYIDELLPLLKDSEWRVLSYLTRQIFGWEAGRMTNQAQVGVAAIIEKTGLSRGGALSALDGLRTYNIVVQVEESRGPKPATWSLQTDADLIDFDGLHERQESKRTKNQERTEKVRTGLSDRPVSGLHHRPQSGSPHRPLLYKEENQSLKPVLKPEGKGDSSVAENEFEIRSVPNSNIPPMEKRKSSKHALQPSWRKRLRHCNADIRKFDGDGRVAKNTGVTPLEVYHEFEPATTKLNDIQLDSIESISPDRIYQLRKSLEYCANTGYRLTNIQCIIDHMDPNRRERKQTHGQSQRPKPATTWVGRETVKPLDELPPEFADIDF